MNPSLFNRPPITEHASWQQLVVHQREMADRRLSELFTEDAKRFESLSFQHDQLLYDFSKNLISQQTISHLVELCESAALKERIESLFKGDFVNLSENRPALHTALRYSGDEPVRLGSLDVSADIRTVKAQMADISESLRAGLWLGATGKPITQVVNLGVGGSDLGPRMACQALKHLSSVHIKVDFVSSIDGNQVVDLLKRLDPEVTLFIVSSKSFSTADTMANAETAKRWLQKALGADAAIGQHFVGVSTNSQRMSAFGIPDAHQLPLWEWVGGRYSVWSAIGLSLAISIGMHAFEAFLRGAEAADNHFRYTDFAQNIPVLQAMIGIWYSNFWDAESLAVLPYDFRLSDLPAYLQQLEMESNGKHIDLNGRDLDYDTAPIIWGEFGPNAQHAFYQLLHQGTRFVPVEFLAVAKNSEVPEKHHQLALANCFAQSRALMYGQGVESTNSVEAKNQFYPGNKPSTTILMEALEPETLGGLMAFYEHKVYVQSVIWNINPFDQWGVELGKKLAGQLLAEEGPLSQAMTSCDSESTSNYDGSTLGLLNFTQR